MNISSMPFFWTPLLLLYPLFTFAQSDEFIYTGFHGAGNNISLDGIATIKPNGIIQLTNTTSRSIGRAMYTTPLQFKNSTNGKSFSFSTSFAFAIVPQYPKLGGHGFAFTISPTKDLEGALPSQYLGLLNPNNTGNSSNHLFAVEFDTVQNFEFNDINDNHVGIDINSLVSNASVSAGFFTANSTQGLNLKSGRVIQAWVDYDSSKNLVNVFISPSSSKPRLPILSSHIDLSPILQNSVYIGFSSSTGLLASYHYILGWSFKMNGVASTLQIASLPSLPGSRKENRALTIGLSVAAVMVMIIVVILAIYLVRKLRNADPIEEWELNFGPHRFSYQELKIATKGFREKQLLGFGGSGRVYKGVLPNSKIEIAVKRISHESKQGLREFMSEIGSIGRLRHRNLVQLQGWCRRRGDLLLVYEFMPNGSLDKYIYDEPESILSWELRFKIIRGVASALLYLHEEWEQIVIHRDVKASNMLLDAELNGRLGDFGLARLYDHGTNPTTTHVVGTLGYLAPELTRTGKSSTCSDVFSFGALLLEITCGRKPVEPKALPEELILVDWVRDKWREGKALDVVDKRMDCYDVEEVVMVLKLGLMCSSNAPSVRPSMRQVVSWLEGEVKVPEVLNAPAAYEAAKNVGEEFDDFVHSYPSSSFEKASVVGDGDLEAGIGLSLNKS